MGGSLGSKSLGFWCTDKSDSSCLGQLHQAGQCHWLQSMKRFIFYDDFYFLSRQVPRPESEPLLASVKEEGVKMSSEICSCVTGSN